MAVKKVCNDARSEIKSTFRKWIKDAKQRVTSCRKSVTEEKHQLKCSLDPKKQKRIIIQAEKSLTRAEKDLAQIEVKVEKLRYNLATKDTEKRPIIASEALPGLYGTNDSRFIFQNCIYLVDGLYTADEKSLLVQAEHDKERAKFEKLKRKFELAQNLDEKPKRRPIPEAVRIAVWRRDQGRCVKCGSRERLEYDHIIPVAEGGGDSVRNIELLCEQCNRSKGAKIQ